MSVLEEEILSQPEALEHLLRERAAAVVEVASAIRVADVDYALIAARGSSDNTARYAQYLWGSRNALPVALAAPSLFTTYGQPPSLSGSVVVAISQSGESPDLIAVVEEARRQGQPTVAITNEPASTLAGASEHVLDLAVGPERAVAATKTYTAQLLAVAMLSVSLAPDPGLERALAAVPEQVSAMLSGSVRIERLADAFRSADRCVVLGRGFNLATAFEWALKLQELCHVLAVPFSSADFAHGPVSLVDRDLPVFAVAPPGPFQQELGELMVRLRRELDARLLLIADPGATWAHEERVIPLPASVPEAVSPIVAIAGAQWFTYRLAVARGLDPDAPRGLRKVTRTW